MWGGMKVIFTIASEIPCVHDFNWEIGESSIIFLENQLTDTATKHTATCRFALLLRLAANIAESNHPQSDADYVSKMNIALKEANESKLWIRLLKECNYITDNEYELLLFDCEKIIKIIFTITQKVKKRLNKK